MLGVGCCDLGASHLAVGIFSANSRVLGLRWGLLTGIINESMPYMPTAMYERNVRGVLTA